jgi:CubicO group peptidase (beta-lactamase class C family)
MVWLGQPYAQRRLFHRPDSPANARPRPGAFHSEPYLADDLFLFDGMNGQIVWIVPSAELVIVRTGLRPPAGQPEWDNAWIPNLILRALATPAGAPATRAPLPAPPAKPPTDGDAEERFGNRWRAIRAQTPLTLPHWLDATETVRGDFRGELPARPAARRRIAAGALAAAESYAARTDSAALLVWHDGALEYERYWGGRGPGDVSETYSMAKSVTGLAVGCAVASGAIASVNDAAARYLPEWRGTAKESVTVRQLLQMTSGLHHERFDYSPGQDPQARGLRTFLGPDIEAAALDFPLERIPGAGFNYNSIDTQLLLAVVERATGQRYAEHVSQCLWQPLGAKDARLWLDRPGGTPRAYSYFVARPRDWLRVGVMIAGRGRFGQREVLPAAWIDAMTTPSPKNPNYGFQAWLGSPDGGRRAYNRNTGVCVTHSAPYLADDVVFFDGGGGHRVYVVPSRRLVIVRTGATIRPDWDDAVLPNAILAGLPQ